jgi:TRAP-type C4-dicarboxylate transport system permease small subunit
MANYAIDRFIRQVRRISLLCGFVAAALIAGGVGIVCEMVFVRYALNMNTVWQTDFVTYCLVAATFIGSPFVLMTRGHVNVDVVPHYMRAQKRRWLALFASALTLAFCMVIAVLTSLFWKEAWDNKWVSDTIWRARLWIPYASMPIGLGLLTLQSIADLLALVTRREPPFGISTERDA